MNTRRKITTAAMALGVLAGSAGIASAATTTTTPSPNPSVQPASANEAPDTGEVSGAPDTDAIESQSGDQSQVDGVNDAAEAPGSEKASAETETDGIDHQFEGQEIGNNGDGIPGPSDANEAPETAVG